MGCLSSLRSQTYTPSKFEVIVVADGCSDGTHQRVSALRTPYALRLIEQPRSGPAAARNRGAATARGEILIFLDDDMEATEHFLSAHVRAVWSSACDLGLGYFAMPVELRDGDLLTTSVEAWWNSHFDRLSEPGHRYTFHDLCSGNFSIRRDSFRKLKGFDNSFGASRREDYEFGIRAIEQGLRLRFLKDAVTSHKSVPTIDGMLRRSFAEGAGDVHMSRRHPGVFTALTLSSAVERGPSVWVGGRMTRMTPRRSWQLEKLLYPVARTSRYWKLRRTWRVSFDLLRQCHYWRGVWSAFDTQQALGRFLQDIPLTSDDSQWQAIDIAEDKEANAALLDQTRPQVVRLFYTGKPFGAIDAVAGAEPITMEHLRYCVTKWYAYELSELLRDEELKAVSRASRSLQGRPENAQFEAR